MRFNDRRGFTLIEVIVVAGIIAILAGIMVPMIFNQIDESRITRAKAEVKSIQSAILAFRKDTGEWPQKDSSSTKAATVLYSAGIDPKGPAGNILVGWDLTNPILLDDLLVTNGPANAGWYTPGQTNTPGWKGPYGTGFTADPWGNRYMINIKQIGTSGARIFIVSAGPDGNVDTELPLDMDVHGNDIGLIMTVEK